MKGGLGIKDLRLMNINLLCKCWWMLENKDDLWQDMIKVKYVHVTPICLIQINKQSGSPI
jgi:hypothetical protein